MSGALLLAASVGVNVDISNQTISDFAIATNDARASYQLRSDGSVWELLLQGGNSELEKWIDPDSAAPGDYEVRVTVNSGSLDIGDSTGIWLALTSNRSWGCEVTGIGTSTANITVDIRLGSLTVASAVITLDATVEP